MKKFVFLLITTICISQIISGQNMTPAQYVAQYKDIAIREMKRMGVPAAISLAQGLLETESGNSDLVKKSNNHFGIKCKSTWTAESTTHDDDAPGECFRVYKTAEDSYRDHSNFLRGSDRYSFLFKLDPRDYKAWAYGLRKAGYATNPHYPEILIKNIEDNDLQQYTLEAVGEVPVFDASKYNSDKELNDSLQSKDNDNDSDATSLNNLIINGSKALLATKGTSLLAIATQNDINLSRLLEMNDLQKDGLLEKDQYIFLEKKQKQGNKDYYIVQQDETMYDVAQKNGVVLQNLYDYNNLTPDDNVYPGTKIILRPVNINSTGKNTTNGVGTNEKKMVVFHKVQPKENLYSISKYYSVSVEQLKDWNNLNDNHLKIGQQLIVSK